MSKLKVFVPQTMLHFPTASLFKQFGHMVVSEPAEADVICLTGGEDINPRLYGQLCHVSTSWNTDRDAYEVFLYEHYDKPFVGICRGAQLLCALNDGELIQDITTPHPAKHGAIYLPTNEHIVVNSYHHQACMIDDEMEVIMAPSLPIKGIMEARGEFFETSWKTAEMFRYGKDLGCQYHPELSGCSEKAKEIFMKEVELLCAA